MKTIYIIFGEDGAYEDYREWSIRAFLSETRAKLLCKKYNAAVERLRLKERELEEKYPANVPNNSGTLMYRHDDFYKKQDALWADGFNKVDPDAHVGEYPRYGILKLELDERK
ncbi:MAG: hypothetical protein GX410_11150 [Elusimicrobia bacterium]|nr:hypothetical protein [Elusimicrobiota bacterium]